MHCILVLLAASVAAADTGSIVGTVAKPDAVKSVAAVRRDDPPVTYPGKLDAKTGQFTVPNLPLDKDYDLVIDLVSGARLEGVNLKVKPTDFKDGDPPLIRADEDQLKAITKSLSKFEDVHEFLAVGGNAQHAAVVVNKLRTKPFYESKPGEVVWRLEVWFFEREELDDPWVKEQDTLFVIHYRERLPRAEYDKKAITVDPKLGGLKPTAKDAKIDAGKVELPDGKPGVRVRNGPVNPEKRPEKGARMISHSQFGKLRLAQFLPDREQIATLEDWEFLDRHWVGEALGFSQWLRLEEEPKVLRSLAIDFATFPKRAAAAALEAIDLPVRPGMTSSDLRALFGKPSKEFRFVKNRVTYEYALAGPPEYGVSCTVLNDGGLSYLVVTTPLPTTD